LGAKLLTPPKVLTKKGVLLDPSSPRKRKPIKKSSSLEEVVKDIGSERMKKVRDKDRFEEAGWRRIENITRWRWTYFKVPAEKKSLMVSIPPRNHLSRLAVFSLYFSDEFLSYLLFQREAEMSTYWAPSRLGLVVNLQLIKQV